MKGLIFFDPSNSVAEFISRLAAGTPSPAELDEKTKTLSFILVAYCEDKYQISYCEGDDAEDYVIELGAAATRELAKMSHAFDLYYRIFLSGSGVFSIRLQALYERLRSDELFLVIENCVRAGESICFRTRKLEDEATARNERLKAIKGTIARIDQDMHIRSELALALTTLNRCSQLNDDKKALDALSQSDLHWIKNDYLKVKHHLRSKDLAIINYTLQNGGINGRRRKAHHEVERILRDKK